MSDVQRPLTLTDVHEKLAGLAEPLVRQYLEERRKLGTTGILVECITKRVESREDLRRFEGWTLVAVSGGVAGCGHRGEEVDELRLRLRPPGETGWTRDVNVMVGVEVAMNDDAWLTFCAVPVTHEEPR